MRGSQLFGSRAGFVLVLIVALAPLGAAGISFSGTDVQSQFTSYSAGPVIDTPGLFTFNDTLDSANPTPTAGVVTAEDGVTGLAGGQIDLEMLLDPSYDASGPIIGAPFTPFIGAGGNDILIWDASRSTVLLAFSVSFVNVRNANGLGSSNLIAFGDPEGSETRINSELQVIGGSLAAAVGGTGSFATLDILLDPIPELSTGFGDFLAGYPGVLENSLSGGVVWSITMTPEPGTGLLLGSALVALGVHGRRRRRR